MIRRIVQMCGLEATAAERLLRQSSGMTGAELERVRRECGLRMLREHAAGLSPEATLEELHRVQYGEFRAGRNDPQLRERLAVHEIGHALVHSLLLPGFAIEQVSIVARSGDVGGFVAFDLDARPEFIETAELTKAFIATALAGREAEMLRFGPHDGRSSGARQDLAKATRFAWAAVTSLGMDEEFGAISLQGFGRPDAVPAELAARATARVESWIDECGRLARDLLVRNSEAMSALVEKLLQQEVIEGPELMTVIASFPAAAGAVQHGVVARAGTGRNADAMR